MNVALKRILSQLGDTKIIEKIVALKTPDMNSLMLSIFQAKTKTMTPKSVLIAFSNNRFSNPSDLDPIEYHKMEIELLSIDKKFEINTVLISPSAPLGSCSAFGCVDQNNVISSLRGTETISDPSNMLFIIIADSLKKKFLDNDIPLHYATTTRVVRGQAFTGKGFYAHFGVFCIVSSGKDKGSYSCESELLLKHLNYYNELLKSFNDFSISVCLRKRCGYTDTDGFFDRMGDIVKSSLPNVTICLDVRNQNNAYYKGLNFKIYLHHGEDKIEIADGGFVNWISEMTGNKKDRCLISGVGIDRLLTLGDNK